MAPKEGSQEAKILVASFLHLMASQVASRVLSFLLNVLTDRRLSSSDIGLSAVQFPLITTSIFMLSREGFRRGCIRSDLSGSDKGRIKLSALARVVTVAWLTVPVGVLATAGTCALVVWWQGLPISDHKTQAVLLLGVAAIVELLSEPLYILAQCLLLIRVRAFLETFATLAKCISTYFMLLADIGTSGGLVFAYGQLVYAACLLVGYWGYFLSINYQGKDKNRVSPLLPSRQRGELWLDSGLLRLCGAFTWQSAQKLALAEGEKFVLVLSGSTHNQGVYGLVEKLGSLVVRSVLQPFEESAFTMFAKAAPQGKQGAQDKRGVEKVLLLAIKGVSLIGLIFVAFGPSYSYLLLRLLYGQDKSDSEAPRVLAAYCFYVFIMALNGITEAFLHASVSERQLATSNAAMVVFSVIHVTLSVRLIRTAGSTGLIVANCCNMLLRIGYSLLFTYAYFKDSLTFSLTRATPRAPVLGAFAAAAAVSHWSERTVFDHGRFLETGALHVAVGAAGLAVIVGLMYKFEQGFINEVRSLQGRSREPQEPHDSKSRTRPVAPSSSKAKVK